VQKVTSQTLRTASYCRAHGRLAIRSHAGSSAASNDDYFELEWKKKRYIPNTL
jgi:hypothetical protein